MPATFPASSHPRGHGATFPGGVGGGGGGGNAYTTINGDSGSATAATASDTLSLLGGVGIDTAAAEGSPDSVTMTLDLVELSDLFTVSKTDQMVIHNGFLQGTVEVSVFEAALDHDALTNFVAGEHVDILTGTVAGDKLYFDGTNWLTIPGLRFLESGASPSLTLDVAYGTDLATVNRTMTLLTPDADFNLDLVGISGEFLKYDGTNWTGATVAYSDVTGTHVLADTSGLGPDHTTSGLTIGQVLRATGTTTAAFQSLQSGDLPSHTHVEADITDLAHVTDLEQITINSGSVVIGTNTKGDYIQFDGTNWVDTPLRVPDTNASHWLNLAWNEDRLANQTLNLITGANNVTLNITPGTDGQVLTYDTGTSQWRAEAAAGGSGDVTGPASSTLNALARFSDLTGKVIKNSGVIVDDVDACTGMTSLTVDNINLNNTIVKCTAAGSTLSLTTTTNGNVDINPQGTGTAIVGNVGHIQLGATSETTERDMYPGTDLMMNLGREAARMTDIFFGRRFVGLGDTQTIDSIGHINAYGFVIDLKPFSGTQDNLERIDNGKDGQVLIVRIKDLGDSITVVDNASVNGIRTHGGASILMNALDEFVVLMFKVPTVGTANWYEIVSRP